MARAKGEFHKSLSRVRILFPNNEEIVLLLNKVDDASASSPPNETVNASNPNELEVITENSVKAAIQNVNETIVKTTNEVVRGIESELIKQGYGEN